MSTPSSNTDTSNNMASASNVDRLLIPKLVINYYLLISSILFILPTPISDMNFFHALLCAISINLGNFYV